MSGNKPKRYLALLLACLLLHGGVGRFSYDEPDGGQRSERIERLIKAELRDRVVASGWIRYSGRAMASTFDPAPDPNARMFPPTLTRSPGPTSRCSSAAL